MSNLIITKNEKLIVRKLIEDLDKMGYSRSSLSELESGNYINIGGTITIYPVNFQSKVIISLFGNQIESILISDNKKYDEKILISENLIICNGNKIMPDQHVVHIDHGIGRFMGLLTKESASGHKIFIKIEYLNNSYLYLPLELKDNITKYIGVGKNPKLNKLGSDSWTKTKKRAYENSIKLAKELLKIYARREVVKKDPYIIDMEWDKEIRKTFEYCETEDQEKAICDVYMDLSKSRPMDRLIVGDVGFGKTEVALRAIVQAISNKKQAAIICPTTILAGQHYANISSRMKDLPIKISILTRMTEKEKVDEDIKKIKEGKIDVIIGTHKLLSSKIRFPYLDLVIIDEEQKFGVSQKEYFKKIRESINVLSLSATPIPRTLFISLSGIRDISQINQPPAGRKPIITECTKYLTPVISKYIQRELKRKGQIYYLYNDVKTMPAFVSKLRTLIPNCIIEQAHGQMTSFALAKVMSDFIAKKINILVCSTIIENGLDLKNVNTLIVDKADKFGLSQLYQIRGRIGRSDKQSYCLLTYREKKLSENAYKRLKAIISYSELGTGYNIALSDLEIRGGGNILGREQHGSMEAVGIVLYSQLLSQAVNKIKELS